MAVIRTEYSGIFKDWSQGAEIVTANHGRFLAIVHSKEEANAFLKKHFSPDEFGFINGEPVRIEFNGAVGFKFEAE